MKPHIQRPGVQLERRFPFLRSLYFASNQTGIQDPWNSAVEKLKRVRQKLKPRFYKSLNGRNFKPADLILLQVPIFQFPSSALLQILTSVYPTDPQRKDICPHHDHSPMISSLLHHGLFSPPDAYHSSFRAIGRAHVRKPWGAGSTSNFRDPIGSVTIYDLQVAGKQALCI